MNNQSYNFQVLKIFFKNENSRELLFITGVTIVTGTVVFHLLEGWTWLDSFCFSMVSLITLGHGDFSPQTSEGKTFTILYIIAGIGIILNVVQVIFDHFREERKNISIK